MARNRRLLGTQRHQGLTRPNSDVYELVISIASSNPDLYKIATRLRTLGRHRRASDD
jgi:hypothetical protein